MKNRSRPLWPQALGRHYLTGLASRRVIGGGEIVIIDFGVRLGGYCCDLTRSYAVGKWGKKAETSIQLS